MEKKFRFLVSKQHEYKKSFKVKEHSILDNLLPKSKTIDEKVEKKNLPKSPYLIMIGLTVLLIGGTIAYFGALLQFSPGGESEAPYMKIEVKNLVSGSFGNIFDKEKGSLAILKSRIGNADSSTATFIPLTTDATHNVYLLKTGSYNGQNNYNEFIDSFALTAKKAGLNTEFINDEEIDNLPSGVFVVVPSGRFPYELADDFKSNLRRGIHFVYIGGKPLKAITKEGVLKDLPTQNFWQDMAISFSDVKLEPKGLYVEESAYSISNSKILYGVISQAQYGNGMFFIVPKELDDGWFNGREAAEDTVKLISEGKYLATSDKPELSAVEKPLERGTVAFVIPMQKEVKGIFAIFKSTLNDKTSIYVRSIKPFFDEQGYLFPEQGPSVLPMGTSNAPIKFYYYLNGKETSDVITLYIYDETRKLIDSKVLGELPLKDENSFEYYNSNLPEGNYLFMLKGSREYAKSIIQISELIVQSTPDFDKSRFKFEFYVGDIKTRISKVKIAYKEKSSEYSNTDTVVLDLYDYFAGKTPAGYHTFKISAGTSEKEVTVYNPPKTSLNRILFNNPINLGLMILAIIIFGGASLLKPKEDERLFVDIPEFPAVEKIKISLKAQDIVKVMENVNEYYKWKNTPLKISEIKAGLKNIIVKGKQLIISDFNLEYLLEKMITTGLVKKSNEYYGLSSWEKDQKRSIEELALFRKIRDICIENAVLFTQLEKKQYDMKITLFKEIPLVFFTGKEDFLSLVRRMLAIADGSTLLVITPTEDEKEYLIDKIFQSGREFSLLRYYLENGSISVLTIEELSKKIKELRG